MKKYLKQKLIIISIFIVFYYVIEIIAFSWVGLEFLPGSILIDFLFLLFIVSPILIIPSNKWAIAYASLWLLFVNGLFVTNANTFDGYFELFSFEQFKLLGEATDILNLDYISLKAFVVFFSVTFVYILVIRFIYKGFLRPNHHVRAKTFLKIIVVFIFAVSSLMTISSTGLFKSFEYYNQGKTLQTLKRHSIQKYGILAYYYKEAQLLYFKDPLDPNYQSDYEAPLISEYHGLLEGYNVFTIMIESGEAYAVHPLLTPNLYKFASEGINLSNVYNENKTNVSEVIGITGHYPTHFFDPLSYNYQFENSIPVILGDAYETAFFHDNYSKFYARGDILPMMGFDSLYFHEEIFPGQDRWKWDGNLTLDSVTASQITDLMFQTNKPFYYFWTTLLTHGPYNEGELNLQKFKDLGYYDLMALAESNGDWSNPLKGFSEEDQARMLYYQAAMMDVDKAIGILIDKLLEENQLDNTLFLVFSDHSAYYHKFNRKVASENAEHAKHYEIEIYEGLYTIYNERLTQSFLENNLDNEISKFISTFTIAPTILDLLGEDYNDRFMLGNTIFSDKEEVFYSNKLTTFFTDKLYSYNGQEIIYQRGHIDALYLESFRSQSELLIDKFQAINDYYLNTRTKK